MDPAMAEKIAALSQKAAGAVCGPGGLYELGMTEWKVGVNRKDKVKGLGFVRGAMTLREAYEQRFQQHGEKEFIVFGEERVTFKEFWRRVGSVATALIEQFGLKTGDRVGIAMQNSPEWMVAFIAATAVGCVAVPLNSWWQAAELEYGVKDAGCKVVFCDDKRYSHMKSFTSKDVIPIVCRNKYPVEAPALKYQDILNAHMGRYCPPANPIPDDTACIMYTSGTTGHPKGVVQTHRGICTMLNMTDVGQTVQRMVARALKAPEPLTNECMICVVPLFHATASHHVFLSSILAGRKIVLMDKWDAGVALKHIARERPTGWTGVPTMVQDLMEHPDFAKTDVSSLKLVGGGGAPTPKSQVTKMAKKFSNAQPSQGYGLTETNGAVAIIGGEEYLKYPGSTGKPLPIVTPLVVDPETGVVVKPGQRGELLVKSPLTFAEYWRKPEATNESLVTVPGHGPGWFKTGDLVEINEEGYIFIMDRAKDIIIRGGENISCSEVESAFFSQTPGIMEISAFGLKDRRLGEAVALLIHPKPGSKLNGRDIVSAMKASNQLAAFKIPEPDNVFFTDKQLPRGATGKILKREIRDKYNKMKQAKL